MGTNRTLTNSKLETDLKTERDGNEWMSIKSFAVLYVSQIGKKFCRPFDVNAVGDCRFKEIDSEL
jgi:hypothetical protein